MRHVPAFRLHDTGRISRAERRETTDVASLSPLRSLRRLVCSSAISRGRFSTNETLDACHVERARDGETPARLITQNGGPMRARARARAQCPQVVRGETRRDSTARGNLNSWKSEWTDRASRDKAGVGGEGARCKGLARIMQTNRNPSAAKRVPINSEMSPVKIRARALILTNNCRVCKRESSLDASVDRRLR